MRQTTNPNNTLRNLRNLIDEVENLMGRSHEHLPDEEQLETLKENMHSGFNRLLEYSTEMSDRMREETRMRLRNYYDTIENRLRSGAERTTETVRTHPYRTVFIATGILLIGGAVYARYMR